MYNFPKNLYSDIRIEETYKMGYGVQNGEVINDFSTNEIGAMIRVYDGNLWYTCSTTSIEEIQKELDSLASMTTPNNHIYDDPMVRKFEVNVDKVIRYNNEKNFKNITRDQLIQKLNHYLDTCIDKNIPEINLWGGGISVEYKKVSFYSSKGADLVQDFQNASLTIVNCITVDGITTNAFSNYTKKTFDELDNYEKEIIERRDKYLDFAKNAVDVESGDYTCVLASEATSLFTHESFGHKSEADYMLNDKTLQDEWIIGKKVGNSKVSICDDGQALNGQYMLYDDEGTKTKQTWLIKDGVLCGRLHDAKSASTIDEELTGNCRTAGYGCIPMVRMTTTYMDKGNDDPKQIISEVKDGIYIEEIISGTGTAIFTMNPGLCYRIRDGKICEPVRVNVITGNVFKTLHDVDAVGNDLQIHENGWCGKNGQTVSVAFGGPTIRVKSLTAN